MDRTETKAAINAKTKSDLILQIKVLKTYQPVEFNKQLDTYFTPERQGMKDIHIEFNVTQQLIHIRQGKIHRIVVPANVQYMDPA